MTESDETTMEISRGITQALPHITALEVCTKELNETIRPLRRLAIQKIRNLLKVIEDLEKKQFNREAKHVKAFIQNCKEEREIIEKLKIRLNSAIIDLDSCFSYLEQYFTNKKAAQEFFTEVKGMILLFLQGIRALEPRLAQELNLRDTLTAKGFFIWKKLIPAKNIHQEIGAVIQSIKAEKDIIMRYRREAGRIQERMKEHFEKAVHDQETSTEPRARLIIMHFLTAAERTGQTTGEAIFGYAAAVAEGAGAVAVTVGRIATWPFLPV